jgi:glycosyltransferase involved in cell wall biosynthesis
MQKVKVCLASPSFFPTYGGAQLRFLRYMPGLQARAIDMYVLTGTPTEKEVSNENAADLWGGCDSYGKILPEEEINGTRVNRICLPRNKSWRRWFIFNQQIVEYCKRSEYRPAVVQFVTNLRPRAIPWLIRLRMMRIPTIYAVTLAPVFANYSALKVRKFRILFNLLSRIVTNSSAIRDMLVEIGVTTPIDVIPNGVNLKRFRPIVDGNEKSGIRQRLGIPKDAFVVTAIGAVSPRKGSDLLAQTWARLAQRHDNLYLLYVGPRKDLEHPGLSAFRQRIEQAIEHSGRAERVQFAGLQDNVEDYLRASDMLVLASEREGMPNSMLEAMASGLPVVITPFIGLTKDLGEKDRHYLMVERNIDDLEAKIESLLNDPAARQQLAIEGRNWVVEHMDVERCLDRYAAMYRQISS